MDPLPYGKPKGHSRAWWLSAMAVMLILGLSSFLTPSASAGEESVPYPIRGIFSHDLHAGGLFRFCPVSFAGEEHELPGPVLLTEAVPDALIELEDLIRARGEKSSTVRLDMMGYADRWDGPERMLDPRASPGIIGAVLVHEVTKVDVNNPTCEEHDA